MFLTISIDCINSIFCNCCNCKNSYLTMLNCNVYTSCFNKILNVEHKNDIYNLDNYQVKGAFLLKVVPLFRLNIINYFAQIVLFLSLPCHLSGYIPDESLCH